MMEEHIVTGDDPQAEPKPELENILRRWIFSDFSRKGVRLTLAISLSIFALYMAGSFPDIGFPDSVLFFLLRVLRYVSLVCCVFSLLAMGYSVHRLVHYPSFRAFFGIIMYFVICLLCASFTMLDSVIVAATVGNV